MRIRFTLPGSPITKKNHSQIVYAKGRPIVIPSRQYKAYEAECGCRIPAGVKGMKMEGPVNLQCVYYMPTRRRVDLVNLLEATCDILVKYGVLADDSCKVVASHDGSRVRYDKEYPRVEIEIIETDGE